MKKAAILAFAISASLAAAVWALSITLTGKSEPWDADEPYYLIALAIAGAISGAAIPKHLGAHYTGAVVGQAVYELVFLKVGPLFVLGLAFLAGYSTIFLAATAIVASFRKGSVNETTAPSATTLWVWLFPLAYGLHIAEEYWLHFPNWVSQLSRFFVSDSQFLFLNGAFWLLMVACVVAIRARTSLGWLILTLAAILGINAALHLLGSLFTRTYSPGSITAAFLYLPLVLYAFRQVLPRVTRGLALWAVALGAAVHAGVMLLAARPSLLPAM